MGRYYLIRGLACPFLTPSFPSFPTGGALIWGTAFSLLTQSISTRSISSFPSCLRPKAFNKLTNHSTRWIKSSRPKRGSTIEEGGDTTISSPGRSPKNPLPGIGLHDPLHDRQACPEFIAFNQGVGQIYMFPVGAIFVPFPSKTGTNLLHPRPPPQPLRVRNRIKGTKYSIPNKM